MKSNHNINQIVLHLESIDKLCQIEQLGDIFSYSKVKEVLMAHKLGHTVPSRYSGADGYEPGCTLGSEYKSTIGKNIQATYHGISVQDTWELQLEYLKKEKILKYPKHYYARFEGISIAEIWMLEAKVVLKLLLPKLKRNYLNIKNLKDPRLGASISKRDIYQYGKRII